MNLQVLLAMLVQSVVAGGVGACVPRRRLEERIAIGSIVALLVFGALWLGESEPKLGSAAMLASEWPHLLNVLIGLPLIGSLAMLVMPSKAVGTHRAVTMGVLLAGFAIAIGLLRTPMTAGWHYSYVHDWIPALGIRYHVAVDGISIWLVLLASLMAPIAAWVSFGSIKANSRAFCFSLLLLQASMLGAFVSLDLILFYVFWELMLVPMMVMIGVFGSADRIRASLKFFLVTMAGSMLMLGAIVYLGHSYSKLTGTPSFDLLDLHHLVLPQSAQVACFWAFAIAFFVKVPLFPLHTWLPDAHTQAPTGGSILLAAILLKMGAYGYLRFASELFPHAAGISGATLAGIAVIGGIIWGALCAWRQRDLKQLVAYSSVAHMGYVMLGIIAGTLATMQGALLAMINHGITTGALFLLVGVIYERRHTRMISEFGGLASVMPVYATIFVIIALASIGVPGTNGFVGEFLVIMGTFSTVKLGGWSSIDAVIAAGGVVLAAVYMLGVVYKVFWGPVNNDKNRKLVDLTPRETVALAPLVVLVFGIGLFPSLILDRSESAVSATELRQRLMRIVQQSQAQAPARLVPNGEIASVLIGESEDWIMRTLDALDRPLGHGSSKKGAP